MTATQGTVRLRPLRAEEFDGYLTYFVPDYAAEIAQNYDLDLATATRRAENAVATELAQGVDTPGQVLLCIENDDAGGAPLGYVWCKPDANGETVFISDFYVDPAHRGQGVGRAALAALENRFAGRGCRELRLRVAASNDGARRLYEASGFGVTGINMSKQVDRT